MLEKILLSYRGPNRLLRRIFLCTAKALYAKVGKSAAAMTYYLIFAIFPFAFFVSMVLGALHLPMISLEGDAAAILPEDVVTLLNVLIAQATQSSSGSLLTIGLIFTIWFPLRAVGHMIDTVSLIYRGKALDGIKRKKRLLALTVFLIILIPVLVLLMVVGESVLRWVSVLLPLTEGFISLWTRLRFLPLAAAVLIFVTGVYAFSVDEKLKWRHILPGAFCSMIAWVIYSAAFAYYVDHMGNYSLIYGSIGTVIAFLVWLNVSITTMLVGAIFNRVTMDLEEESRWQSPKDQRGEKAEEVKKADRA